VIKLLAEDERRRAESLKHGYSWRKPRFETEAAVRRLRVVNALLIAIAKAGCRASIDKQDLLLRMTCNDTLICVRLYARKDRENRRWLGLGSNEDVKREDLVFEVESASESPDLPSRWADTKEERLERQVPEIAVELLVRAEMSYRVRRVRHREWLVEREKERLREIERQKAEAERKERERLAKLERDRTEHLLKLAERLRKSDDIRALVASMAKANPAGPALEAWRSWALGWA